MAVAVQACDQLVDAKLVQKRTFLCLENDFKSEVNVLRRCKSDTCIAYAFESESDNASTCASDCLEQPESIGSKDHDAASTSSVTYDSDDNNDVSANHVVSAHPQQEQLYYYIALTDSPAWTNGQCSDNMVSTARGVYNSPAEAASKALQLEAHATELRPKQHA
jgi:hypothetical protein